MGKKFWIAILGKCKEELDIDEQVKQMVYETLEKEKRNGFLANLKATYVVYMR